MKTYIVSVKCTVLDYYEIEAKSPDHAMEIWMEGRFLRTDEAYLQAEPVNAQRKRGQG